MIRFLLWGLLFWVVMKVIRGFRVNIYRSGGAPQNGPRRSASSTPLSEIEEATFEDVTLKPGEEK